MPIRGNKTDITDVDQYIADNPHFAHCRRGHAWPDDNEVPLIEAYDDPSATHHRVKICSRCESTLRQRWHVTIRGQRVIRCEPLPSRTAYAEGYLARGVRISRSYVRTVGTRNAIEAQLGRTGQTRRRRRAA